MMEDAHLRPPVDAYPEHKVAVTSGMLGEIFVRQRSLMDVYESKGRSLDLTMTIVAGAKELFELLDETNWKPWKTSRPVDAERQREEVVDAFHFVVQAAIKVGMDARDLYEGYMSKAKVNEQRQHAGY